MRNRIAQFDERRDDRPQHIGQILAELLARYSIADDPRIAIVETAAEPALVGNRLFMEEQPCSC
jgi:hypothetical protein